MKVSELRASLLAVVARLKQYPSASLVEVEDWHEHDGYVTSPRPCSWEALEESLRSDSALYEARHDDIYVRRAFYPEDDLFLLRFDLLDEDDDEHYPGIWGDFDLCAEGPLLAELRARLQAQLSVDLVIEPAKAYFDRGYAG